ncbi:uncharacterized protein TNCT_342421 [Trichonephila clavata]|uniref:MATH domain-containing protein n=1 Tax=Trichonephila clavata TaxID=2740835 RepID=A0A8X6L8U7_TRICU|nr:uncharacterized protein TNCT_342421 [Trichonephila clavata]
MAASDMSTNDVSKYDFMFMWAIENCPVSFVPSFAQSPSFHAEMLLDSKWHLEIKNVEKKKLVYSIHRDPSTQSYWFPVDVIFEISFLGPDGSVVASKTQRKCFHFELCHEFILEEDAFGSERARFIVNDTLTIRCCLWSADCKYLPNLFPNQSFANTRLEIERRTIFWCVKNFSEYRIGGPGIQYWLPHLSQMGHYGVILNFEIIPHSGKESVLITILQNNLPQRVGFDISILDLEGKKRFCNKSRYDLSNELSTVLNVIPKEELMKYKESMLFNDSLCLRCELEIEPARYSPPVYMNSTRLE